MPTEMISRSKMFHAIAMVVLYATLSGNAYAQELQKAGRRITRNGNVFELSAERMDTTQVINPITGEEKTKVSIVESYPIKVNGEDIADHADQVQQVKGTNKSLATYIMEKVQDDLSKLGDGIYVLSIGEVITDSKGRVVYFDPDNVGVRGIRVWAAHGKSRNATPIDAQLQERIVKRIIGLIDGIPALTPAVLSGYNVAAYVADGSYGSNQFSVKDHKFYKD